ncbi:MAG: radical SAM protein, partial [Actinomycetota bacterium]
MRVLLIQPNQGNHIGFRYVALTEPLGLETIAACLPHHDVRILDMRLEKGLIEHLRDFQPQAVGITVSFSTDVYNALEILRAIKEYDSKIYTFVGGHHASLNPPDFLRGCVDAVVIGEGEETTPELLDLWEKGGDINKVRGIAYLENGNLKFTPSRELIRDLNVTPIPSRELTKKHRSRYFYKASRPISSVETARGCPFRCKFCSVWQFYKRKYRARSPERVLREIESISTKNILFTDDNFLQSTSRANRIYELIKEVGLKKRYAFQARTDTIASHPEIIKKWKTIGLDWVLIGFESIWDEELQEFNKDNTMAANEKAVGILQENKVGIQAAFIVNPLYGRKEFQMLIKYVKKMKLYAGAQFTILTPL